MPIRIAASDFRFITDEESLAYLRKIVETMMRSFGITREESIGRINRFVAKPTVIGENELYREKPAYWANHFMFGHHSLWWITGAHREKRNLPPLVSLPYDRDADA